MTILESINFKRNENSKTEKGTKIISTNFEHIELIVDDNGKEVKSCYHTEKNNDFIIPLKF